MIDALDIRGLLNTLPHQAWRAQEQLEAEDCYPAYVAIAAELQPHTILEIGTCEGYGLISFWLPMGLGLQRLDWVDNESYVVDSNAHCVANIQAAGQALGRWVPQLDGVCDRNDLRWQGRYDLIHVDGDHTFTGAMVDLVWAWGRRPKFLLVDDYDFLPEVRRAVQTFSELSGLPIEYRPSLRGWAMFRIPSGDLR